MGSFFREWKYIWSGYRATKKAHSLIGRASALQRHGRPAEALAVTHEIFVILAKASPEYRLHPFYVGPYVTAAVMLDELAAELGQVPACPELREALSLINDSGIRFNKKLAGHVDLVKRRLDERCR